LAVLDYELLLPTPLDFLKIYMEEIFGIKVLSLSKTNKKEADVLATHKNLMKWEDETDVSSSENSS